MIMGRADSRSVHLVSSHLSQRLQANIFIFTDRSKPSAFLCPTSTAAVGLFQSIDSYHGTNHFYILLVNSILHTSKDRTEIRWPEGRNTLHPHKDRSSKGSLSELVRTGLHKHSKSSCSDALITHPAVETRWPTKTGKSVDPRRNTLQRSAFSVCTLDDRLRLQQHLTNTGKSAPGGAFFQIAKKKKKRN